MRAVVFSYCAAALLAGLAAAPAWGQSPPEVEPRRSAERAPTTRDEAELKRLREQLGAARQRNEQLEAALVREQEEASRLRRMLAERGAQEPRSDPRAATAELERLRRAHRDQSDRLEEAEQRARDLQTQLERERSRERGAAGGAAADMGRLRDELVAAQAALMSQAGQLQRLQRELEPLRAARAQAEERADAAERRERALQAQLGERGAGQDALSAGLAAAQREARDLRARVDAARGEAQRAEADRQASANALAGTPAAEAEAAELRAQVQALQSGSAVLRDQLAEAQARERLATEKAAQLDAARGEAAAPRDPLDEGPAQPWMVAAAGAGALLAGAAVGALGARRWRPPKPREVPVSASVRLGDWSFDVQRATVSPSFAVRASLTPVQMSVRNAVLPLVRVPAMRRPGKCRTEA